VVILKISACINDIYHLGIFADRTQRKITFAATLI